MTTQFSCEDSGREGPGWVSRVCADLTAAVVHVHDPAGVVRSSGQPLSTSGGVDFGCQSVLRHHSVGSNPTFDVSSEI
jgi:hypothetical protein